MKRQLTQFCLLAAATMAAPSAFSESVIVKCIDDAGRVTFTDRPCEAGAATVRMASMPSNEGMTRIPARIEPYPLAAREDVPPPARELQRRAVPMARVKAAPLASDVATLKAARAQFLVSDVGSRETLAGLD